MIVLHVPNGSTETFVRPSQKDTLLKKARLTIRKKSIKSETDKDLQKGGKSLFLLLYTTVDLTSTTKSLTLGISPVQVIK